MKRHGRMTVENRKNPMWRDHQQNQTRAVRPVKFTAGKLFRELYCHAFSDVIKLYDSDGELMTVMEFDDDTAVSVRNCDVAVRRE